MSTAKYSAILTIIVALSIQTNGQLPGLSLITNAVKGLSGVMSSMDKTNTDPENSSCSTSSTTTQKSLVDEVLGGSTTTTESTTCAELTDYRAINELAKCMHTIIEDSAKQAKTCVNDAAKDSANMINKMDSFLKTAKGN